MMDNTPFLVKDRKPRNIGRDMSAQISGEQSDYRQSDFYHAIHVRQPLPPGICVLIWIGLALVGWCAIFFFFHMFSI